MQVEFGMNPGPVQSGDSQPHCFPGVFSHVAATAQVRNGLLALPRTWARSGSADQLATPTWQVGLFNQDFSLGE